MDAKQLASVWGAPDNSRLTAKQQSFRLPVHVAAKIAALSELYPAKSKTQIVGDLLAAALSEMEKGLPAYSTGRSFGAPEGTELFFASGPAVTFRELTNKHYRALEEELGNEAPEDFFKGALLVDKDGN